MSKLAHQIAAMHRPVDNALIRALSMVLALGHTVLLLWEPTLYSQSIGGFNALIGPLFIWAVCSGVIFGVGFTPRHWIWKLLFSPYCSLSILTYLTIAYLVV